MFGENGTIDNNNSVCDLLIKLHAMEASGLLTLQHDKIYAKLYFDKGNIIRVYMPGAPYLGTILLCWNKVAENDLKWALELQQQHEPDTPLGQILRQHFIVTDEVLEEALLHQIKEGIKPVLKWTTADYIFDPGQMGGCDGISASPHDLMDAKPEFTEAMLIDLMRLLDKDKSTKDILQCDV